jgi:hypothetical protein
MGQGKRITNDRGFDLGFGTSTCRPRPHPPHPRITWECGRIIARWRLSLKERGIGRDLGMYSRTFPRLRLRFLQRDQVERG